MVSRAVNASRVSAVERGVSYDVHELDAASNNGVEAMRDLIEKASLGTPGRHKVYILDEVHMLTKSAEAALLKTLEEPPPHVVFVLATTDPQKMSDTIRSRTQHLQFHLLPADTLAEHIRWVATDAGLDVSDASLEQALSRGGGSARDTLSALELLASTGDEGMEIVPTRRVRRVDDRPRLGSGADGDRPCDHQRMEPRTLTEELIGFLRNGFLALMAPELVQVPSNRLDALASQAQRLGAAGLVRGIEFLGAALSEMRHAPDPRVLLDVATVQLTADSVGGDTAALLQRLERLERQVAAGVAAPVEQKAPAPVDPSTGRAALGGRARASAAPPVGADAAASGGAATAAPAVTTAPAAPEAPVAAPVSPAGPSNAGGSSAATAASTPASPTVISADVWENTIRPALRGMARAVYAPAGFVAGTASTLTLSVPNAVHLAKCEEQRSVVETALAKFAGAPVRVELVDGDGDGKRGAGPARDAAPAGEARSDGDAASTQHVASDVDSTPAHDAGPGGGRVAQRRPSERRRRTRYECRCNACFLGNARVRHRSQRLDAANSRAGCSCGVSSVR